MEQQLKYGLQNIMPQDEITDFDLEASVKVQQKMEAVLAKKPNFNAELGLFEIKYEIVDRQRYAGVKKENSNLRKRVEDLQKKLNVYKRNEKYQFWGYHHVTSKSPTKQQDGQISQCSQLLRSSIKVKSLFMQKHNYDQIDAQRLLVMEPHLRGEIQDINKRLRIYQDEILLRDKNIRDLEQTVELLKNENQIKETDAKIQSQKKEQKILEIEERFKQLIDQNQQNYNDQQVSLELVKEYGDGAHLILNLLQDNHRLNQKNKNLSTKISEFKKLVMSDAPKLKELQVCFQVLSNIFNGKTEEERGLFSDSDRKEFSHYKYIYGDKDVKDTSNFINMLTADTKVKSQRSSFVGEVKTPKRPVRFYSETPKQGKDLSLNQLKAIRELFS